MLTGIFLVILIFVLLALPISLIIIPIVISKTNKKKYEETTYFKNTGIPYRVQKYDIGRHGEYLVYKALKLFELEGGKFLFNVYIPKKNGETTEIDVILITHKGIFVIESKNFSGWIFGNDTNKYWTQCLPSGRDSQKYKFYNPVMQNRAHIHHLKILLNKNIPIYSIVVFSDKCEFRDVTVYSDDVEVIYRSQLYMTVANLYNRNPSICLSDFEINNIYVSLLPYTNVSTYMKQRHIESIQSIQRPTVNPISAAPAIKANALEETCPLCGNKLVIRTARYGTKTGELFYGCASYPKCRYTKPID